VLAVAVTWRSPLGEAFTLDILEFGHMAAVLANVEFPHVALSIATRSYMPGAATAVTLKLPAMLFLVAPALAEHQVGGCKAVTYGTGAPVALLLSIPVLFCSGRALAF